jgi:hypothetical protein
MTIEVISVKKKNDAILSSQAETNRYYALIDGKTAEKMPLVCDGSGYTFRYLKKPASSHSGSHSTPAGAIEYAIQSVTRTRVFQFDTLDELYRFCLS